MNERAASMTKSATPEQTPSPRALLQLAPYLLRYANTAAATQSATAQNGGYHNGMGANLEPCDARNPKFRA
jgi:hypothetical protein